MFQLLKDPQSIDDTTFELILSKTRTLSCYKDHPHLNSESYDDTLLKRT